MVLTHSEAIRLSSEARAEGDRETARRYSRIARDLQGRASRGETKVNFYDTESGRIRHSEAGSPTYVNYMLGASERYVPVSETQVKEIREFGREQAETRDLIVPSQRAEQDGRIISRTEPGIEPGTAQIMVPSETQQWTVTYDAGFGERKKTFDTEEEATTFMASLALSGQEAVETRGRRETLVDQVGGWSQNVVARTGSVNEQTRDFNSRLTDRIGFGTDPGLSQLEQEFGVAGIPGPAAGPRPGSFGEKLKHMFGDPASKKVRAGLEIIESPFTTISTPLRTRATRLKKEAAEEKAGFKGLSKYFEGVALATGAAAFDVATINIRPGLIVKSAVGISKLVTIPEEREALVETVKADPFGFTAETVGGAFFGAKLADFGRTAIRQTPAMVKAIRAELKATELPMWRGPQGIYGPVKVPPRASFRDILRRAKFVAERETAVVDFSKLLQDEARFRFPEEVVEAEFLDTFRPESTHTIDSTFNAKFGKWSESLVQEDFGIVPTRGTTIRTAKSGYLGFGKTGADLVPMIIPEEFAVPTTIYRFRRTPLTIPSGRPGIPIEIPQLGAIPKSSVSFTDFLAAASITATTPKVKKPTAIPQVKRPGTIQQNLQRFNRMQSNLTKNIIDQTGLTVGVTTTQTQPTLDITIPTIKQIQRIDMSQIMSQKTPEPVTPPGGPPPILFPPRPPRKSTTSAILEWDPRKKRKPRKKTGIKQAVEKRMTPLGVINFDPRKKRKKR